MSTVRDSCILRCHEALTVQKVPLHFSLNTPARVHAQLPLTWQPGLCISHWRFSVFLSGVCTWEQINTNNKFYWMPSWCDLLVNSCYTGGKIWVQERKKKSGLGQKFVVHHWIWYLPSLRAHWEHAHHTQEFYPMFLLIVGISDFSGALYIHSHFVTHYS